MNLIIISYKLTFIEGERESDDNIMSFYFFGRAFSFSLCGLLTFEALSSINWRNEKNGKLKFIFVCFILGLFERVKSGLKQRVEH